MNNNHHKNFTTYIYSKDLKFTNVNIAKYCLDKDIEVLALKLKSTVSNICILALYIWELL
jgi:hypothetical protein